MQLHPNVKAPRQRTAKVRGRTYIYWIVRWRPNGEARPQQRQYPGTPEGLAQARAKAIAKSREITEAEQRGRRFRDHENIRLADLVEFIETERVGAKTERLRGSSLRSSISALRRLQKFLGAGDVNRGGNVRLADVTHREIVAFQKAMKFDGASINTAAKVIRSVKATFTIAEAHDMAPEGWNPCKHAAVVIRSKKPNQIRLLTDNERDAIFEACRAMDDSDWWTAFVDMAIYGGLRAAEIENLCFEDIDFSNHEIRIRPKQHTASTLAWRPKTDAGQRTIPLLPASTFARLRVLKSRAPEGHSYLFLAPQRLAALLAMRDENDKSQARIDDRETLIPTERRQFSRTLLPKANTIMRNQHGSDGATLMQDGKPTVGLHDLRRFAISRWLVNGMEMHEACEFAGHTDIGVMYAHYASILPGRFDKARGIAETIAQADSTPVIGRIGAKPSATSVA